MGSNKSSILDHMGHKFWGVEEMCVFHDISRKTYYAWRKKGLDINEGLLLKSSCCVSYVDHIGHRFSSVKEMCTFHGINEDTYRYRREKGLAVSICLSQKSGRGMFCEDHEGNIFESVADMCKHHNVLLTTYMFRKHKGYDLEACLTGKGIVHKSQAGMHSKSVDFEDREFSSAKDMCEYHGVSETPCEDHEGNKFPSISAMCAYHGINRTTYLARRAKGYDIGSSLSCKECEDHEGNKFPNVRAMCNYYGINQSTYLHRRAKGYDIRSSLTGEGVKGVRLTNNKECEDHEGNKFPNVRAMCAYHGVLYETYKYRRSKGYDLKTCLTGKETQCKDKKD